MSTSIVQRSLLPFGRANRSSKTRRNATPRNGRSACFFPVTKKQFDDAAMRIHGRTMLDFEDNGDVTIITFRPKQLYSDDWRVRQILDELRRLVSETGRRKFVLDFENTDYISGAGLSALVSFCRPVTNVWGRMVLCGIDPTIREVFTVTRLTKLFHIAETKEEAMAWIKKKGLLPRDNESPFGVE